MKGVLFVLYIGFSCSCFAQEKGYELGYVVTISNDTIKGLIKNRNSKIVFEDIKFKKDQKSKVETFTPRQLKSYKRLEAEYYSKRIDLDDGTGFKNHYFLEQKIKGDYLCYYEFDILLGTGNNAYYGILEKPAEKSNVVWTQGVWSQSDFRKKVSSYLKDELALSEKISNGTYKTKDIEEIVREYNELKSMNNSKTN